MTFTNVQTMRSTTMRFRLVSLLLWPLLASGLRNCSLIDFRYWGITFPDGEPLNYPPDIDKYLINKQPRVIDGETKRWLTWSVDGCPTFIVPPNDSVDPDVDSSQSSTFVRSELRELLTMYFDDSFDATGIQNQWVTSKATASDQSSAGGINGNLKATAIVNSVTESGSSLEQEGRIVVGQIHGKDDEPVKLYYQKIAGQDKGSVYFTVDGENGGSPSDRITFFGYNDKIISDSRRAQFEPTVDGIALGVPWDYEIDLTGDQLQVTITHGGKTYTTADAIAYSKQFMSESSSGSSDAYVQRVSTDTNAITIGSWYDNDWMYFKAGVYNQNKNGDGDDVASVTFTWLVQSHETAVSEPPATVAPPATSPTPSPVPASPTQAPDCQSIDFRYWGVTFPDGERLNEPSDIDKYLINKEPRVINGETKDWITWSEDGCPTFVAPPNASQDPAVGSIKSTSFVRSELRELLITYFDDSYDASDIENQWVTSKAGSNQQEAAGRVNGYLKATIIVNSVTESGSSPDEEGRIIVGQIRGVDNEPVKLYYQKIAGQDKGSVYVTVAGEDGNTSDRITFFGYNDKVTSASRRAEFQPRDDGIALGVQWDYEIDLTGDQLQVTITHGGKTYTTADAIAYSKEYMSESSSGSSAAYVQRVSSDTDAITIGSWYDNAWFHFKAGVYNQNQSGDGNDVASVTFTGITQEKVTTAPTVETAPTEAPVVQNGEENTSSAGARLAGFWIAFLVVHVF